MQRVHVVAAVIFDPSGEQILIAKRPEHLHQGGLWEFPGGKLEANETPKQGLIRELLEELGVTVTEAQPFMDICYDYPDKQILLDVWKVLAFKGTPVSAEGQEVCWVDKAKIANYEFPKANKAIVEKLAS